MSRADLRRALPLGFIVLAVAGPAYARVGVDVVRRQLEGDEIYVGSETRRIYVERNHRLLWHDGRDASDQAVEVIRILRDAGARGLDPADYEATGSDARRRALADGADHDAGEVARFDLALTEGLVRLLSDLRSGRAPPRRGLLDLTGEPKRLDFGSIVEAIADSSEPAALVTGVEPKIGVYARLKSALGALRAISNEQMLPRLAALPVLRPGAREDRLPLIRARLVALGDLSSGEAVKSDLYDATTVQAVERFQRRHGLEVDGIVGEKTLRELRVPLVRRIRQLELSLERLRWIPDDLATRVLIVNIPEFALHGVRSGARTVDLRTDVVVGATARARRTPVLRAEMTHVVFRPYWNVPSSIARNELVPKERRSPGALLAEGFELVSSDASGAQTARAMTDENLAALSAGALRVRQKPGAHNALGLVKFVFPNRSSVYLHDTPSKSLFERTRRAFSHGCIRVEDPVALAAFVLGSQGWTRARIERAMAGPRRERVDLSDPVSVLLVYATAVVQGNGDIYFFEDIYGLDEVLDRRLRREPPLGSEKLT